MKYENDYIKSLADELNLCEILDLNDNNDDEILQLDVSDDCEDETPYSLTTNQLFSSRDAERCFSRVCNAIDENGSAFIIKNDELSYAVISFEEYKALLRDRSNYHDLKLLNVLDNTPADMKSHPSRNAEKDSLLCDVLEHLSNFEEITTSRLQRTFKIGYGRAARIIDYLEQKGFIAPYNGSKPRAVIATRDQIEATLDELKK